MGLLVQVDVSYSLRILSLGVSCLRAFVCEMATCLNNELRGLITNALIMNVKVRYVSHSAFTS